MKKIILSILLFLPFMVICQNSSNTIFINQINDNYFFDLSDSKYNFSFEYKNIDNINLIIKKLSKNKFVESCKLSKDNLINIVYNTNNINDVSLSFINSGIIFLDYNSNIIPFEYIKIDNSTIPPPDNNVDMSNTNNVLYHRYIISSIEYKLHFHQQNLTKLSSAAKFNSLSNTYIKITKEQETINKLNQ
jgi:hypothetical protein